MGQGLIPADGEVWKSRRRAIVPALHKRYVASMVGMFGDCAAHGAERLAEAAEVRVGGVWGRVLCVCVCWRGEGARASLCALSLSLSSTPRQPSSPSRPP